MIAKNKKKEKNSFQKIFPPLFLITILILAFFFLAFSNWQINKRRTELKERIKELKAEIETLEKKNEELSQKISQVKKEDFLEKEARERFNLKKPGEEAVVVLSPEEKKEEKKSQEEKKFWQRILEKIGF